jgi:hypothetical protein
MAKESIGLLMANWVSFVEKQSGAPIRGLGFMPVEQLPNGKIRVSSASLAKKYAEMGFKPVVSVVSEVTRHGTKITHSGAYSLHFLESTPPSMREALEQFFSPVIVDGLLEDFYNKLNAHKEAI